MKFHPFVIPFIAGVVFLLILIVFRLKQWLKGLDRKQHFFVKQNFLSLKTLYAIVEVFRESLLHFKIYRKNPVLGYMHMSLAFGWFMLIVFGKVKSVLYAGSFFEPMWLSIFFNFFVTSNEPYPYAAVMTFLMDFFLLIVLSGLLIAFVKRIYSRLVGMKKTTKHILIDRIALVALWGIFPLRLFAEASSSALYENGGFLTAGVAQMFSENFASIVELPLWWAYSLSLSIFFFTLPFSRYMHIPAEVVMIFLKKWGVKTNEHHSGFTNIQLHACAKCGICIDACQLDFAASQKNVQSAYFIGDARYNKLTEDVVNNCLMCGRCHEACPVGIELTMIRQQYRNKKEMPGKLYYNYVDLNGYHANVDIIYYAGCMTHLTPGIIISMKKIFQAAGMSYWFMDEEKGVCCGRPLRQQGFVQQAKDLVHKNLRMIHGANAKLLVTSCPICYVSFKEEYALQIPLMHHTEFIESLIDDKKISLESKAITAVYHDPCELGRNAQIYDAPRNVLKHLNLKTSKCEKNNGLCCGSSLSNAVLDLDHQIKVRDNALNVLLEKNPDVLVTACPMCKKAFTHGHKVAVMDIAEVVAKHLNEVKKKNNF